MSEFFVSCFAISVAELVEVHGFPDGVKGENKNEASISGEFVPLRLNFKTSPHLPWWRNR